MKRFPLAFILMFTATVQSQETEQSFSTFTAAWWNVENLFDTRDDPHTADDDFTPRGSYHWTRRKLTDKINGLYKTLLQMELPDVVGLAEVENERGLLSALLMMKRGCKVYVKGDYGLDVLREFDPNIKVVDDGIFSSKYLGISMGLDINQIADFEQGDMPVFFPSIGMTDDEVAEQMKVYRAEAEASPRRRLAQ